MAAGMTSCTSVPAHGARQRQCPPDYGGAFPHARQTVVAARPLCLEHRAVDAPAAILHAQPELIAAVADVHVDARRLRVLERIAERLDGDLVDLVTEDRPEVAGRPLRPRREATGGESWPGSAASSRPSVVMARARSLRSTTWNRAVLARRRGLRRSPARPAQWRRPASRGSAG